MTKASSLLRGFLKAMFSDYNGIQVFLYPGTIFYWISNASIVLALSTLLSVRLHYLPLSFFGRLSDLYLLHNDEDIHHLFRATSGKPAFGLRVLGCCYPLAHQILCGAVGRDDFFVFTEFMSYFYGIKIPLKHGIMLFFRLFTILLIIAYYIPAMWLKPYRKRRYGKKRSELLCYAWIIKNPLQAVKYSGMLFLVMLAAVRAYVIVIAYAYDPLLYALNDFLGVNLHVELLPITKLWTVVYNLFMLAVAFMLSNLCFFPIIKLAQLLADALHPIKLGQVSHAKS
ncbi:MAG: hypothetical protein LRZ88_02785 [Candidatus Cloacimonetes bacterium]|nr:hypothetical protein [Candidatus Cloacimonadota bacterium]